MILVLDASVLIDLCHSGLTALLSNLGKIVITDLVLFEIDEPLLPEFEAEVFEFVDVTEILALRAEHRSLSLADASAFLCAKELTVQKEVILLTGDSKLRKLCKACNIPYHGILWVLDQFLKRGLISPKVACQALKKILAKDSWLPKEEVNKRLKAWC
ncbi:PIN domain-containing protein [Thermosulfuriphilus ammonigenes]|uniref:PIN domain-containing protein n=1 Tax=Thermosulfuriphilus ammonigenes TaxID=1936021 RepID=A0A6G7PU20_9BACT|nr:PIN domain-containing protein [Thermosulfuriphilus ammonigenes]MBA2848684.1 putative nucleic acid-binding protein [Thermosulfuriphilus ammonigenes]QIJ71179.1 PIN domain-containing protein [Thermosulfuriphilus ammonigenes]